MCQTPVERLAKYRFEWTDKWYEPKFSRYRWKNSKHDAVVVSGDKIRYQNGFGAMQYHIYECHIRVKDEKIIYLTARPGRY